MSHEDQPSSEWRVFLTGDSTDLRLLASHLGAYESSPMRVLSEGDAWYLTGDIFSELTDATAVHARASVRIETLSGAGKLHLQLTRAHRARVHRPRVGRWASRRRGLRWQGRRQGARIRRAGRWTSCTIRRAS